MNFKSISGYHEKDIQTKIEAQCLRKLYNFKYWETFEMVCEDLSNLNSQFR